MSKAIIVIDMQNDFVTGTLANRDAERIIPFIKNELKSGEYDTIYFTQDTHYDNYMNTQEGKYLPIEHCIYNTNGWDIIPEFSEFVTGFNTIQKPSFGYPGWISGNGTLFTGIDEIVLVGTCTDICVVSNALILKAFFPEITITVLANGCAGSKLERHIAALETMRSCQINVID